MLAEMCEAVWRNDLAAARQAVDLVLKGHEPNPALAVDRHWNLVAANSTVEVRKQAVSVAEANFGAITQSVAAVVPTVAAKPAAKAAKAPRKG